MFFTIEVHWSPLESIGVHWSPLKLKIIDEGKNKLDNEMELEIADDDDNKLIKVLLTIEVHWSCRLNMRIIII